MVNIKFRKTNIFVFNQFTISFKGLIFYKKFENGVESLKKFMIENGDDWLNKIEDLLGNFILYIKDNEKKNDYIFTDNSGMSRLYYYNNEIYDCYLNLIKECNLKKKDINYFGIVEYLQFGYNIFYTMFNNVYLLERDQYIYIENNEKQINKKNISSIFFKKNNIDDFYSNLKYNFKGLNICCDLTAGIDSRFNVSLLSSNKINFKTSISGVKEHIDVVKCEEISKILNKDMLYYINPDKYSKNILDKLFLELDGQYSILEYYKNYNLSLGVIDDNINLRISGAGGELYKYSWIMTDFPWFNKKKFSLKKIYEERFNTRQIKYNFYSNEIKRKIIDYQQEFIKLLEQYREENNIKTYDRICYETIMRKGASTQMIQSTNNYIRYCPLLEYSVVHTGINLSIFDRVLYMMHRKKITKYTPQISKIKTNLGLTVNDSIISLFSDMFYLVMRYVKRLKRKIFKQSIMDIDTANNSDIFEYCKQNDKKLIEILKENNIVETIDTNKIDNSTYSRLITIAKFMEYLEDLDEK